MARFERAHLEVRRVPGLTEAVRLEDERAHALLAALIVTKVERVGLAANFKKPQHDTTVEKFVFVVGAATV